MATITCARCGASEEEASASFGEEGLICAACYNGETAKDAAQMQAALDDAAHGFRGGMGAMAQEPMLSHRTATSDARAPDTALHRELEGRGSSVSRSSLSTSIDTPLGSKHAVGFIETWTLPRAPSVQASFAPEGMGAKLKKLFTKELQVGDAAFDAAVYIRTDTPDATRTLLASPAIRACVADIVAHGGNVSIEGATVEGHVSWPEARPRHPRKTSSRGS